MALQNGAGDFVQGAQNQTFQINALPSPVLKYICNLLTRPEYMRIRRVCWGMQDFIDNEYGIHAYLPCRNFKLNPIRVSMFTILRLLMGRLDGTLGRGNTTDAMIKQAILNLKGKVIRSLEMNEMHPDFNPLPFESIVHYPRKLRKVSLKYVDVKFIITVLSSCRNLSTFHYETGFHRQLPNGVKAWIELGTSFKPVPIPLENEQLIEFVTELSLPIAFQVNRLTSLSLSLQFLLTIDDSDWANILFLLLSLSQGHLLSLQDFKFTITAERYIHFKNRFQIIACVGQFLSGCPSLKKLEYISRSTASSAMDANDEWIEQFGDNAMRRAQELLLPQNVFSSLFQKFGSDLLKELQEPIVLGIRREMLGPTRQIMRETGMALRNLQDVILTWSCPLETELFQILLSSVPSVRTSIINHHSSMRYTGGIYSLLFPQLPLQRQPFHCSIEKLCFCRFTIENVSQNLDDRRISLSQLLETMISLKHLEIAPIIPDMQSWQELALPEHEPLYKLESNYYFFVPNAIQTPNITLDEVDDPRFQQLKVLKLTGVKLSTQAAARLIQLTNLKELVLEVIPEYRHDLFGINSGDLMRLMGSLRKLEKISVNMILFPEDDTLKAAQRIALEAIGGLQSMRRVFGSYTNPRLVVMKQYKLRFGQDD